MIFKKSGLPMQAFQLFPSGVNYILTTLQKTEWRGKYKVFVWLSKLFPNKVIVHNIDNRRFCVPVSEWCFWLEKGPENYYLGEFLPFCDVLNNLKAPFTFFDLGADIGVVSSLIISHCSKVKNIIAIEPNPHSFQILKANLKEMGKPYECKQAAVSNFDGNAKFYFNENRSNDHEGYIDETREGATEVLTLDVWYSGKNAGFLENTLVFKIDVEGQELAVFEGAKRLISQAKSCIVLLEIHPDVLERIGQTPEDIFIAAENTACFKWFVPELGNKPIARNSAFYEQFELKQYDVIGVSQNGDI
ncbi:FkbM family methyltransferase [Paraglaciecola marina]|uniref:FkbM family methyltransferase n=1 Tax=Paraglaciecola marina TaxID=2500157 RepID=UPI001EF0178F|nr:FkbM family methyltransferase [Paraglaciecola marina]